MSAELLEIKENINKVIKEELGEVFDIKSNHVNTNSGGIFYLRILITKFHHLKIYTNPHKYEINEIFNPSEEQKEKNIDITNFINLLNSEKYKNYVMSWRNIVLQNQRPVKKKKKKGKTRNWERIKTMKVEDVFAELKAKEEKGETLHRRLQVFYKKGLQCTVEGCVHKGAYFALEKDPGGGMHIDLFTHDGILMTVDHHNPLSNGGKWELKNLNPMCEPHNAKKGSKIPLDVLAIKE
jgi:5-methylcytosine-specific restriction endonuclease McrA